MADETPSRLSRLWSIGAMTGRVATSYVREQVKSVLSGQSPGRERVDELHIENARDMAQVMSRMKGAAMKLGQQIAVLADAFDLPPEVSDALSALHAKAEPIPFHVIQAEVERELERPLTEAFAWFDPNPLGTASLAQAHAARLHDGREVVVKVMHRGVKASVDTDLAAFKAILFSRAGGFGRSRAELDDIFDEVRARLLEELDYLQEAVNISEYRRLFGNDPRLNIPAVHPSHSTEVILTLDRIHGVPIDLFAEMATPDARQRAATTLSSFYYTQVFKHRVLHADPHPGNYLFAPDGTVGVLDFGCIKRFDEFWIATYARAAVAAMDNDREASLRACVDLGSIPDTTGPAADALWRFILAITQGFRMGEITLGADDEKVAADLVPAGREMMKHPDARAPRHVLYLHRSLGGLYGMSRKLKSRQDFGAILREHARFAIDRAEGRR